VSEHLRTPRSRQRQPPKAQKTAAVLQLLKDFESRNVTFVDPNGSWPVVWERARGAYVWDIEGKRYVDLTAGFGVASAGHANSQVVAAGQKQMAVLLHAMGDVHPHALKAQLARELSRLTFERWSGSRPASAASRNSPVAARNGDCVRGKTIFCNSGFEAVEAALKTARLATGRRGVVAFHGAYHGLGYGALNATHRPHFRWHFEDQLGGFGHFLPFPGVSRLGPGGKLSLKVLESQLDRVLRRKKVGAVLVEPVQVRGGINIPSPGFLPLLRRLCSEYGALLILDEIYTGFGRTGKWFACEHPGVTPDLICLGKALTGGFPLSACVGRADLMDAAWPPSSGEAIHTSTFLGHPVGCAMALAQIEELQRRDLIARSAELGVWLMRRLSGLASRCSAFLCEARGLGLLAALELRQTDGAPAMQATMKLVKGLLRRGFIFLPEGEHANVLGITPPLTISKAQLGGAVQACERLLLGGLESET
jgi:4-aminobutyrate aminotransferase-like enzyme